MTVTTLPTLNACLNATACILLIGGLVAIRRGNRRAHGAWMMGAFVVSGIFLASYLTYHFTYPSTRYGGEGWDRTAYLFVLMTHIVLAAVVPFMAIVALWHAFRRRFDRHRRVTRWLLPIWLYVSVTGVVIFLMLRPYYPL